MLARSSICYEWNPGRCFRRTFNMCYTVQKFAFLCGHSRYQDPSEYAACIFDCDDKICTELGNLRTLVYYENRLCPKCGGWKPAPRSSVRPEHRLLNTPFGLGDSDVKWLSSKSCTGRFPTKQRKAEIDMAAMEGLMSRLEDRLFSQADHYEWLVRLIVSLPKFVDRKALVRTLEPSLGRLFDEHMQEALIPLFRNMEVPDIFSMTMTWKRDVQETPKRQREDINTSVSP